ncbi:hypothetical protein OAO11_03405 [Candidatus Poseidoniaceae archaeon]|nr:hypothetical protein [Candidatus Poseidoniaceae archaeon]
MSDVEALTGILNAVLQSGGIHGRNFGEFTNYSVDEYPISMLQEMWSWGFPIAVTKTTPNSTPVRTYVPMDGLADIVADVEGFVRQRMCHAPYVLFPLDELSHHADDGMRTPEAVDSLCLQEDAVEPLFRDLVGFDLAEDLDSEGRARGQEGFLPRSARKYPNETGRVFLVENNLPLTFVSGVMDLDSRTEIRWMWSLLRAIAGGDAVGSYAIIEQPPPYHVEEQAVLDLFRSGGFWFTGIRPDDLPDDITELTGILERLGIEFSSQDGVLTVAERLYLSLTPRDYMRSGLVEMDENFLEHRIIEGSSTSAEDTSNDLTDSQTIVAFTNDLNPDHYPPDSVFMRYSAFLNYIEEQVIDSTSHVQNIILQTMRPGALEQVTGNLLAFVNAGGRLIVHSERGGRAGSTYSAMNWTLSDFERFGIVPRGWRFSTAILEDTPIEPIYTSEFRPEPNGNNPMERFGARYGLGWVIFVHPEPSRTLYTELIDQYTVDTVTPQINPEGAHWRFRHFPRLPLSVANEPDIYPIIGYGDGYLSTQAGLQFNNVIGDDWETGRKRGVDLVSVTPRILIIEVDTIARRRAQPDSSHQLRTAEYRREIRESLSAILQSIPDEPDAASIDEIINQLEVRFQATHYANHLRISVELARRLWEYHSSNAGTPEDFADFLGTQGPDEPGPPTMLLGTGYGMPEDAERSSARNTSLLRRFSLWTYRDLYEFSVRTDVMEPEERREHLLDLCMTAGPVYFALRDRLPEDD